MSVLYVVRHGQASFFGDNYDQLSPTGIQQSQTLGDYWVENEIPITEVYSGSLRRQLDTAAAVGERFREAGLHWPDVQVLDGLNEYHADDVLEHVGAELVERDESVRALKESFESATDERERYRTFHRFLESVMECYIAGKHDSYDIESWRQFHDRVQAAKAQICAKAERGRTVAVFTSGGPIGVFVQTNLEAPEQKAGALNWRVYNASVTQFTFSKDRMALDQFNSITHLQDKALRTYR